MTIKIWLFAVAFCLSLNAPLCADDFYKGKSVRIIVGGSAGGGFDTYSRIMARHMGKHIPGNPAVMVENMTGAGTLIAAKYLHSGAKPDGLAFGIFNGALILGRALGMKGIDFDVRELEYLGVPVQDSPVCTLRKESGVANVDQWLASKSPIKIGGLSPGNSTSDVPRILRAALELPIQVVDGYKGTAEVRLAADAGEVNGGCWAWESVKVTWAKAVQSGDAIPVVQVTAKKIPDLPNVPLALDLAKTEEARMLIKAGAVDPSAIVRVYVTTPRTPKDRLQILRRAFMNTLTDPDFVAEMKKSNLDINPLSGDQVKKIVDDLFKLDPVLLAKLSKILSTK
ncbi:MAG TPA: tripartite tricarboxylate transporter substrate-binding protein [Candidatus Binatia bacterium]|nr:tripartite tricarboxylate transporter substrate-binding protein [Candidatus Binatia bacterium]